MDVLSSHTLASSTLFTVGDAFDILRMPSTGADDFFVINEMTVAAHDLPAQVLVPMLPAPRRLSIDEISNDTDGLPIMRPRNFLLNCALPETTISAMYPGLHRYLQLGDAMGVKTKYLCASREPWFLTESIEPAPLLCTYAGVAARVAGRAFRFILNRTQAIGGTGYLNLYPKPPLSEIVRQRPAALHELWSMLSDIPASVVFGPDAHPDAGWHLIDEETLAHVPIPELEAWIARSGF